MKKISDLTKWKKALILAGKIAIGSSLAIYTADFLKLEYASAAGIITLLTLVTTKKGTLKLSMHRLLSFMVVEMLTFVTFAPIQSEWIAYGLFVFLVVLICEMMGWRATISTNAVIGTHFLLAEKFTPAFLMNEFLLVVIGITFAFLLNLFQDNHGQKGYFVKNIPLIEARMQDVLKEVADYLDNRFPEETEKIVWTDVSALRNRLIELLGEAWEYEENNFKEGGGYYADYFEMRLDQCRTLLHLHDAMRKIKTIPRQAKVIENYIRYLSAYVTEINVPALQLKYLDDIFAGMKKEPMPVTREEFENRALLYHILMDLEEFLHVKERFIEKYQPGAQGKK